MATQGQPAVTGTVTQPNQSRGDRSSRVAMLIPAYNPTPGQLERTLRSIDRQRHPNLTIVIVDDGSAPPIAIEPCDFACPIVVDRLAANSGITVALNHGLQRILAEDYDYVARQDVGDVDVGQRIALQAALLDQQPDVAIVGSHVRWVEPDGTPAFTFAAPSDHDGIMRRMRSGPAFIHPTVMMRASALRQIGDYSANFPHCEDYELFFRLVQQFRGANIAEVLVDTELNPAGISIPKRRRQLWNRLRTQLTYFAPLSWRSWTGAARTVALLLTPYRLLAAWKRRRQHIR